MNKHFRVGGRLALKLEELGIRVAAVLRRAGLPQDLFEQTRVLVTRNSELLAMLAPQFDEELQHCNRQDSFAELVRGAIQESLTGHRPAIEEIARRLHISSRTLQRRLQDAGSSFQRVLDQARHQMARHYLSNSVLELNEAAYLLGYRDANSFVRAFRGWEGIPPGHWREARRTKTVQ